MFVYNLRNVVTETFIFLLVWQEQSPQNLVPLRLREHESYTFSRSRKTYFYSFRNQIFNAKQPLEITLKWKIFKNQIKLGKKCVQCPTSGFIIFILQHFKEKSLNKYFLFFPNLLCYKWYFYQNLKSHVCVNLHYHS